MKLIFAALLLGLVAGQEQKMGITTVPTTEEVLVRCRRTCTTFCQFGTQIDSTGCPICQCLEDPCLEAKCPKGQMCVRKDSCDSNPCTELPYTCEKVPCPQVMCSEYCEYGLEKSEYGCDTCTCKKNPCNDIECNADEECQVTEDPACPEGAYCNKVGECVAAPSLKIPEEPMLPKCSLIECRMLCRFGFKKDDKGCDMCECKTSPCEDFKCGDGEKCQYKSLENCQHDICDLEPHCSVQPICEHMLQKHMDNTRMMSGMSGQKMMGMHSGMPSKHPLECDEDGGFMPRQCHHMTGECWCVNDLGEEIEGTRCSEKKPDCPYNKTSAVKGHIHLRHDIQDNLDKHTEILRPILVTHLGKWMMIEEKYIQEVVVTPYGESVQTLRVDFMISGEIEDDIDLASSMHHLRLIVTSEETLIHYESFTLTPVPTSLETHHKFIAEPMAVPKSDTDAALEYYRVHKTTIVVLIGLVLLASILVVMLVQIAKRRRVLKLQRKDNYQQNLAFTNEVYGKLAFLDDLAKDKTPDVEKNEEKNEATA